jgi:uncharacterized membrane protein YdfJ with MMPL/SSD domain
MALLIEAFTFVLLFLAFGAGVLPIKAIVTNVLSLTATFGAPPTTPRRPAACSVPTA